MTSRQRVARDLVIIALSWVTVASPSLADSQPNLRERFRQTLMSELSSERLDDPKYKSAWPPADLSQALVRECRDAHDAFSCYYVAKLLADGKLTTAAAAGCSKPAISALAQACTQGDSYGCLAVGSAYANGIGVPKDEKRSDAFDRAGCQRGNALSCYFTKQWPQACQLGFGQACVFQAKELLKDDTSTQAQTAALSLDVKGCKSGSGLGCLLAGAAYVEGKLVARAEATAASYFERACQLGNANGCSMSSSSDKETGEIRRRFKDGVVEIKVRRTTAGGYSETRGTGFFISPDGVLATNYHVMEEVMTRHGAEISFTLADGRVVKTFEVGSCHESEMRDLCILRLPVEPKLFFALADENPPHGTRVYQIGFSKGLWITRKSTFIGDYAYANAGYVEIDYVTQPGDSGGPIFLADGTVVGVTTMAMLQYKPPGSHEDEEKGAQAVGMAAREVTKMRNQVKEWLPLNGYLQRSN